jgi:hypothetical protein
MRLFLFVFSLCVIQLSNANPYWDINKVPRDSSYKNMNNQHIKHSSLKSVTGQLGIPVLRIQVNWLEDNETYTVSTLVIESSGTPALLARSTHKPKWGSYLGVMKDKMTGEAVYYDSIGTGKEYRKLARAINLRFPVPSVEMIFELYAENPQTGQMELVVEKLIAPDQLVVEDRVFPELEVKQIALAAKSPSLRVAIYAEGYSLAEKSGFWKHAIKSVQALQNAHFPGVEYMDFYAVFNPSAKTLGEAEDLGTPVPEFDSFLGLILPQYNGQLPMHIY